jgi:hypothetical protein
MPKINSKGKIPIIRSPTPKIIPHPSEIIIKILKAPFLCKNPAKYKLYTQQIIPEYIIPPLKTTSEPFGPVPKWLTQWVIKLNVGSAKIYSIIAAIAVKKPIRAPITMM